MSSAIRPELAREWRALSRDFCPTAAEMEVPGTRFSLVLGPVDIPEEFSQNSVATAILPIFQNGGAKIVGAEVSGIIAETGASIDDSEVVIGATGVLANIFTDSILLERPEDAIGEYLATKSATLVTPSQDYGGSGQVFFMNVGDSEYAIKGLMTVLHFEKT